MGLDFFTVMRSFGEFSSTAILIMVGCMGSTVNGQDGNASFMTSVHNGLTIVIVMHIFGFISGAHANPCISIACWLLGYIGSEMMLIYVTCQLTGAIFGYFLLLQMLPQDLIDGSKPGVCMVEPMGSLSNVQIFGIECFLTSVLLLGWSALWDVRSGRFLDSVTLRMGCLVMACCMAGGQLTGASMNPVKMLVPTLFKGNPDTVVLQVGGQLVAAFIVPYLWQYAYSPHYRKVEVLSCDHSGPVI
ncbi:aquaporin-2 [Scaptodrosophila lebanonensis]|uniref:Aquaporin-2 n=1 Tax=Drosophila lebanonensis TaxID=7225 RepID=A0A6J2UGX3_DROLE|nr:aquaporin-2 [Scaptodrosophila lebanonensis]